MLLQLARRARFARKVLVAERKLVEISAVITGVVVPTPVDVYRKLRPEIRGKLCDSILYIFRPIHIPRSRYSSSPSSDAVAPLPPSQPSGRTASVAPSQRIHRVYR